MIIKNNSETQNQNLIYLTVLANQTATNGNVTLYNPTTEIAQSWNHTTRGLTDAGTAVVAIGAVVAVVATAGSAGVIITATLSSAASTAAVSATNASMNADGDMFKQIKTVSVTSYKDTTSKESLKNVAIAGVTAAITLGIVQGVSPLSSAGASGGAGGAGAGAGSAGGATASVDITAMQLPQGNTTLVFNPPASAFASNTINTTATLTERFSTALTQSGINGISQAAAQSAINGDSFTQALKNQGVNLLINAIGQVGANEIATSAKAGNISNATHIAATTTLGCAMAVVGGNNCAAGAASSLVGAIIGGFSSQNPDIINKQQSTAIAQLVGAITAAAIVGPDGGNSVFAASQIAQTTQNVYSEIGVLFTPEEKNQIDQALIGGNLSKAQELVNQFSQGKNLTENQKEKLANLFEGNVSESEFLADLTPEDKEQILLVDEKTKKPTSIGIFFEGTDNDRYRDAFNLTDPSKNIESNVARLFDLYN